MQMAGKPNLSVLFGAQALRRFHHLGIVRGQSTAIVFADIRSAYYTVLMQADFHRCRHHG